MASSMAAGQPSSGRGNPLDQPRDRTPTQREATPEAPPKDGEKTAQGEREKPEPGKDGQRPDSPEPNPLEGENRPGTPPQAEQGRPIPASLDAERWGELPPRVREVFRNAGSRDVPVRYRDWIDAYYRRLSRGG